MTDQVLAKAARLRFLLDPPAEDDTAGHDTGGLDALLAQLESLERSAGWLDAAEKSLAPAQRRAA